MIGVDRRAFCGWVIAAGAAAAVPAWAQSGKPLRMIVPVPPGGAADFIARQLAKSMQETLGRTVVVDNRGGASGTIATQELMRSEPDGDTVLLSSSTSHGTAPLVLKSATYDPVRDFAHIGFFAYVPAVLVVNKDLPVKDVKELVAYAKKDAKAVNFGSSGNGSPLHLWGELFKSRTGAPMTHVPYKGAGPAVIDLVAGRIHVMIDGVTAQLGNVKGGKTRALATLSEKRSALLPDVPTMAELGFSHLDAALWYGLSAPKGTPAAKTEPIFRAMQVAATSEELRKAFEMQGIVVDVKNAADYAKLIGAENDRYRKVIAEAGITPE